MNTSQKIGANIAVNWMACLLCHMPYHGWLCALATSMILHALPVKLSAASPAQIWAEVNNRGMVLSSGLFNQKERVFLGLQSRNDFRERRPELGTSSDSVAPLVNQDESQQRYQGGYDRERPGWNIGDYIQVYVLTPLLLIPLFATSFKQHQPNS